MGLREFLRASTTTSALHSIHLEYNWGMKAPKKLSPFHRNDGFMMGEQQILFLKSYFWD
jgi:hypothetical protein